MSDPTGELLGKGCLYWGSGIRRGEYDWWAGPFPDPKWRIRIGSIKLTNSDGKLCFLWRIVRPYLYAQMERICMGCCDIDASQLKSIAKIHALWLPLADHSYFALIPVESAPSLWGCIVLIRAIEGPRPQTDELLSGWGWYLLEHLICNHDSSVAEWTHINIGMRGRVSTKLILLRWCCGNSQIWTSSYRHGYLDLFIYTNLSILVDLYLPLHQPTEEVEAVTITL